MDVEDLGFANIAFYQGGGFAIQKDFDLGFVALGSLQGEPAGPMSRCRSSAPPLPAPRGGGSDWRFLCGWLRTDDLDRLLIFGIHPAYSPRKYIMWSDRDTCDHQPQGNGAWIVYARTYVAAYVCVFDYRDDWYVFFARQLFCTLQRRRHRQSTSCG